MKSCHLYLHTIDKQSTALVIIVQQTISQEGERILNYRLRQGGLRQLLPSHDKSSSDNDLLAAQ